MTTPQILFVPGMKPKPERHIHGEQVWRCLVEGVRRVDPEIHASLAAAADCFELIGWTDLFYDEYRDIAVDLPSIEAALARPGPSEDDRLEALTWRTRMKQLSYLIADTIPFLISRFANEDMQITLRDVRRYMRNEDNIGRSIRRTLRVPLRKAWASKRPVLLIGHSLGSVIAWDTLWELSRVDGASGELDILMTLGSPLGQRVIQRTLKGAKEHGRRRYPSNIRRWVNFAAYGELTALDHQFANDYGPMLEYGLVESIDDWRVFSHYRHDGQLMVHSEYGYLLTEHVAAAIAEFWRESLSSRASDV